MRIFVADRPHSGIAAKEGVKKVIIVISGERNEILYGEVLYGSKSTTFKPPSPLPTATATAAASAAGTLPKNEICFKIVHYLFGGKLTKSTAEG